MSYPRPQEKKKFSYRDYLRWDTEERYELIDGTPYLLAPGPGREHQRISGLLFAEFFNYLKDKPCEVYAAPLDVRLPEKGQDPDEAVNVLQPDIMVVCDMSKLDDRGVIGAPDLVVEVISPATAKRDLHEKFLLYEKHGVKEYWVVFPMEKVIDVYKPNEEGKYEKSGTYYKGDKLMVGIFPDLVIDLGEVFGR